MYNVFKIVIIGFYKLNYLLTLYCFFSYALDNVTTFFDIFFLHCNGSILSI